MEGDIIFVVRKRLLFKSFSTRKNSRSTKLDEIICRICTYKHYGVEVENGNVIHFVCDSILLTREGTVKKVTLEEFLKDGNKEIDHTINLKFNGKHVVQRAYSRLNSNFGGYHPFKNNCEHFSAWCANGLKSSSQVHFTKTGQSLISIPKRARERIVVTTVGLFSIIK